MKRWIQNKVCNEFKLRPRPVYLGETFYRKINIVRDLSDCTYFLPKEGGLVEDEEIWNKLAVAASEKDNFELNKSRKVQKLWWIKLIEGKNREQFAWYTSRERIDWMFVSN